MSRRSTFIRWAIWLAVALLIFLPAGCRPGAEVTPPPLPLTAGLSELEGVVLIRQPDQTAFANAAAGMMLQVKGQVQTAEDGRARLDLSTGTIVRVAPLTIFTLDSNEQAGDSLLTRLKMEAGRIWVSLVGGSLEVETPSGLAVVRGSYLAIWIDPLTLNVWVSCFEGQCAASNPDWSLDFGTGEGAVLYAFAPGETPPPPDFRQLTWQEFQDWAQNNPEAAPVLPHIIASLTALPSLTPTLTSTATETFTPTGTFTPLPTATSTVTASPTATRTWLPSPTHTSTLTPEPPPTDTPTLPPANWTNTPSKTPLSNPTNTPTDSTMPTPTDTPNPPTPTDTPASGSTGPN